MVQRWVTLREYKTKDYKEWNEDQLTKSWQSKKIIVWSVVLNTKRLLVFNLLIRNLFPSEFNKYMAEAMRQFHGPFPPTYSQELVTWMRLCLVAERGESTSSGPRLERGVAGCVVELGTRSRKLSLTKNKYIRKDKPGLHLRKQEFFHQVWTWLNMSSKPKWKKENLLNLPFWHSSSL